MILKMHVTNGHIASGYIGIVAQLLLKFTFAYHLKNKKTVYGPSALKTVSNFAVLNERFT